MTPAPQEAVRAAGGVATAVVWAVYRRIARAIRAAVSVEEDSQREAAVCPRLWAPGMAVPPRGTPAQARARWPPARPEGRAAPQVAAVGAAADREAVVEAAAEEVVGVVAARGSRFRR